MKRTIIVCIMAMSVWLTAMAINTVTLSSVQGHPNDEVEMAVMLANTDTVTALEVLIPLDEMLSYVDGSAVLSEDRSNGHVLSAGVEDGILKICIYSISLAALNGTEGEVCSFKLKLGKNPGDYLLEPKVIMSDASGKSIRVSEVNGKITLLSPKIEIITPIIDYGRVPIRSEYKQTLSVKNIGNEPLEITDIGFDNDALSVSPSICIIAAGQTYDFVLSYTPIQRGAIESNVTITSNAINPKDTRAMVKAHPFSVNELHVQRAEGLSDEEVTVSLNMNNMEPIAAVQCSFTLPDELIYVENSVAIGKRGSGTDFMVNGAMNGNTLTLFMYSPTNTTLPEGDGELLTFRLRLDGQNGCYELNPQDVVLSNLVMENMISATFGEYVVIESPTFNGNDSLVFDPTPVAEKVTATYTIQNSGAVDLVISKATFLAEGYTVDEQFPLSIAPWDSKEIRVNYIPTAEGDYKTTMQLYTNDPICRMKSVELSGSVYEPNYISLSGENTPSGYHLSFGLNNYTEIVAVQMNVHWLSGMSTSSALMKISDRLKEHSYLITDLGNGVYQILIYSMTNESIKGTSGELFTLDYIMAEGTECRDTEIRVTDIVLSDAKGKNYVSGDEVTTKATFTNFALRFVVEGETISEHFVKAGTSIILPTITDRIGYSIIWTGLQESMPFEELTITGVYRANEYELIYYLDGEEYHRSSVTFGSVISLIDAPVKEGYTFSGWSVSPDTMPADSVVISGTFIVNKYLVTFKIGDEIIASDSLEYGSSIASPDAPVKEGYTFNGWGEVAERVPAHDLTYVGQYSVNSYLLTFIVDGDVVQSDSVAYGTVLTHPDIPTREGYTFSGWSEAPKTMPSNDVTISGTFIVNKYLVTFKIGDEVIASDSLEYGSSIVPPDAPVKEGYTFNGWGEVAERVPAHDLIYEGTYTVNIYMVYYYVNEELVYTAEVAYGDVIPEYTYEPTEEGDVFEGWIGETYVTMPAHDITYTAYIANDVPQFAIDDSQLIVYDLSGRKVEVEHLNELSTGVYIVNGKLMVVK